MIRTPSGHEPVIARVVALKAEQTQLLYFAFTVEGGATMRISNYHAMIANGREVDAVDVKVGDLLPTPHGERAVTAIQRRVEGGGYHIVVPSSRYYADGVEASTYGTIVPGWVNYLGVRYMELRYRLGVPLVASGEGWLPSTMWVIKRYNQLGIQSPRAISYLCARHCPPTKPFAAKPNPRRHLARPTYPPAAGPITLLSNFVTEGINTLVAHAKTAAAAAAIASAGAAWLVAKRKPLVEA